MKQRTIGGRTVSAIGLGGMPMSIEGRPDTGRSIATIHAALDAGVTFIDTADAYGPDVSEELIAEALHPYPDDLVIATKGGLTRSGPGKWAPDGTPEHLRAACEGSLRRLRVEQIPLYQLHRPDPNVQYEESVGALVELKAEGKIRHIGVSNVSEHDLRRAMALTPVVSVQNRYNVSDRGSESMVDLCEQEDLVFLPWAPIQDYSSDAAVSAAAAHHHAHPRQVVLAWLLARSPQMLPIPGTRNLAHLDANVAAAGVHLSQEEVAAISDSGS
jgi:pyridoxine 4-dehydrogenase